MENNEAFYMDKNLNGQSQCALCFIKGNWNIGWSSMMWNLKELPHKQFCDKCKKEYEEANENTKLYIRKMLEFCDKAREYDDLANRYDKLLNIVADCSTY